MGLELCPISFSDACAFVAIHHRHHQPPQGHKYSIGAAHGGRVVGVVIVGRPTARRTDDGLTLEVTRMCSDGTKNCCSFLYAAAWRAARALGYNRLITFVLASESGGSLTASGWKEVGRTTGKSWSVPSRPRIDKHPLGEKIKFEVCAARKGER